MDPLQEASELPRLRVIPLHFTVELRVGCLWQRVQMSEIHRRRRQAHRMWRRCNEYPDRLLEGAP
jgi:hypothetical protein